MTEGNDRGSLEGPPETNAQQATEPRQSASSGFDFNQPTIISLLYLSSFILGVTVIVGVVLAYVWKGEAKEGWENSHYQYLINTFWIGLIGGFISALFMLLLVGFLLLPAVMVLVIVRCVLSLINAQKHQPMPNPGTLFA